MHALDKTQHELFLEALEVLDEEMVEVDGRKLKPSQCYHISLEPVCILFNENCPDTVKEKVNRILKRFRYQ